MRHIYDIVNEGIIDDVIKTLLNKMKNIKNPILKKNINDYYHELYPTDKEYQNINDITIYDAFKEFLNGDDIYNVLGVQDSTIRERIFEIFSKIFKIDSNTIYDIWYKS